MLISFFGADGKDQLDLAHFGTFCRALHAELVRLEFLHYDHARKVVLLLSLCLRLDIANVQVLVGLYVRLPMQCLPHWACRGTYQESVLPTAWHLIPMHKMWMLILISLTRCQSPSRALR